MVAARDKDVAFIVMMAGTGVPEIKFWSPKVRQLTLPSGKSPAEAAKNAAYEKEILALVEIRKG